MNLRRAITISRVEFGLNMDAPSLIDERPETFQTSITDIVEIDKYTSYYLPI